MTLWRDAQPAGQDRVRAAGGGLTKRHEMGAGAITETRMNLVAWNTVVSLLTTTTHSAIGVTISVDRKAHGAELRLRWDHVQALRNELDRLLQEAKQLDP